MGLVGIRGKGTGGDTRKGRKHRKGEGGSNPHSGNKTGRDREGRGGGEGDGAGQKEEMGRNDGRK